MTSTLTSNTVAEVWTSLVCVVEMSRRFCFQHCKYSLHALQKDEDSHWNWYGKTNVIIRITVNKALRKPPELKFRYGNRHLVSDSCCKR